MATHRNSQEGSAAVSARKVVSTTSECGRFRLFRWIECGIKVHNFLGNIDLQHVPVCLEEAPVAACTLCRSIIGCPLRYFCRKHVCLRTARQGRLHPPTTHLANLHRTAPRSAIRHQQRVTHLKHFRKNNAKQPRTRLPCKLSKHEWNSEIRDEDINPKTNLAREWNQTRANPGKLIPN